MIAWRAGLVFRGGFGWIHLRIQTGSKSLSEALVDFKKQDVKQGVESLARQVVAPWMGRGGEGRSPLPVSGFETFLQTPRVEGERGCTEASIFSPLGISGKAVTLSEKWPAWQWSCAGSQDPLGQPPLGLLSVPWSPLPCSWALTGCKLLPPSAQPGRKT